MHEAAEPFDHGLFIDRTLEFKSQLQEAGFTAEEIAAMLGTWVLCVYQQQFVTQYPPEMMEMVSKQTAMINRDLVEED